MTGIVSNPDPGEFHRPSQNGHVSALIGEGLPLDNLILDDLASEGLVIEGSVPYEVITEQLIELEADFAAELGQQQAEATDTSADAPGTTATLPGFETLTTRDLLACPPWCAYGQGHAHGDGFDTYEESAPHRGVELRFSPNRGGSGTEDTGPAEISVQLEQDRDLATESRLTLSIAVNSIEQYATLSLAETQALHDAIGQLLDQTD